jgi:hydroxymethylglutaryl-CoA synthase
MDFTDVDEADLSVGQSMKMMFRVKDFDTQRGFRRYFWKAAPTAEGRT